MHRSRISPLLFAALIVASVQSIADTPPPIVPFNAETWKSASKEKPTTGVRMGSLHVMFEKTTLDDVRKAALIGEISEKGDAAGNVLWLCYTNLTATPIERIWVSSNGEMGGPEHVVDGVSAQYLPNGHATRDCPVLPENLKPLSLDQNLWLNSTESEVLNKLGAASHTVGLWRSYDYQGKMPGKCGGGYDVLNNLLLRIENGQVVFLNASQVTSC